MLAMLVCLYTSKATTQGSMCTVEEKYYLEIAEIEQILKRPFRCGNTLKSLYVGSF